MSGRYIVGKLWLPPFSVVDKPRLHWNKVWQCWQVSNPLALPHRLCVMASHAAHLFNVVNYRTN